MVVEAMELVKCVQEGIKVDKERSKITILESHSASQMTHPCITHGVLNVQEHSWEEEV